MREGSTEACLPTDLLCIPEWSAPVVRKWLCQDLLCKSSLCLHQALNVSLAPITAVRLLGRWRLAPPLASVETVARLTGAPQGLQQKRLVKTGTALTEPSLSGT